MAQKVGDRCTRCDGTGQVYDEVFEYEWTECPYFDVDAGVACLDGRIVTMAEWDASQSDGGEDQP